MGPPIKPDEDFPNYWCLSVEDRSLLAKAYNDASEAYRSYDAERRHYRETEDNYDKALIAAGIPPTKAQADQIKSLGEIRQRAETAKGVAKLKFDRASEVYSNLFVEMNNKACPPPNNPGVATPPAKTTPETPAVASPPGKTTPGTPAVTSPPTVVKHDPKTCPVCRSVAEQVKDIDDRIGSWERQDQTLHKVSNLNDPGIQSALKDIQGKLTELKGKKAALETKKSDCEKKCVPTETKKTVDKTDEKKSRSGGKATEHKNVKKPPARKNETSSGSPGVTINIGGGGYQDGGQRDGAGSRRERRDEGTRSGGSGFGTGGGGGFGAGR